MLANVTLAIDRYLRQPLLPVVYTDRYSIYSALGSGVTNTKSVMVRGSMHGIDGDGLCGRIGNK